MRGEKNADAIGFTFVCNSFLQFSLQQMHRCKRIASVHRIANLPQKDQNSVARERKRELRAEAGQEEEEKRGTPEVQK